MHGVNIRWMYDGIQRNVFQVRDCHTQRMAADIFTKHVTSNDNWEHAIRLLGFRGKDFSYVVKNSPVRTNQPTVAPIVFDPTPQSEGFEAPLQRSSLSLRYVAACVSSKKTKAQSFNDCARVSEGILRTMEPASSNPRQVSDAMEERIGGPMEAMSGQAMASQSNAEKAKSPGVPGSDPPVPLPGEADPQEPSGVRPRSPPPTQSKGSPKSVSYSPHYPISSPETRIGKGKGKATDAAAFRLGPQLVISHRTTEAARSGRGRWPSGKGKTRPSFGRRQFDG